MKRQARPHRRRRWACRARTGRTVARPRHRTHPGPHGGWWLLFPSRPLTCEISWLACEVARGRSRLRLLRSIVRLRSNTNSISQECGLILPLDGALVPAAQRKMRDGAGCEEDGDAANRDEDERREHPRNPKLVAGFQDAVGEA